MLPKENCKVNSMCINQNRIKARDTSNPCIHFMGHEKNVTTGQTFLCESLSMKLLLSQKYKVLVLLFFNSWTLLAFEHFLSVSVAVFYSDFRNSEIVLSSCTSWRENAFSCPFPGFSISSFLPDVLSEYLQSFSNNMCSARKDCLHALSQSRAFKTKICRATVK